ncbi:MAG: hypothetical protein JRF50_16865 [Deltaproteobacteria bacterium]|nr:hypothetical protein [Deltaproteobacteria bacterium]
MGLSALPIGRQAIGRHRQALWSGVWLNSIAGEMIGCGDFSNTLLGKVSAGKILRLAE